MKATLFEGTEATERFYTDKVYVTQYKSERERPFRHHYELSAGLIMKTRYVSSRGAHRGVIN